ncbi:hypothetical protein PFICI_00921 [Pestalotiopsis fici W106-1]|uniref:Uncharacterized protein n=1 Tax=Pestalotiopsis fici (strain W106-1 / CGMCC3.15140) TaxID=1229662 RepID=W3XM08_PESFW|nr:uncharacterized protein PFICI_00921 [Pestalotiopsis fici W106-1]ETS87093.1 hypothetical protein PFICI_00921 [Pestalotiopsis fici W106-1]
MACVIMGSMTTGTVLLSLDTKLEKDPLRINPNLSTWIAIHGDSQYPGFRQAFAVIQGAITSNVESNYGRCDFVLETENDLFAVSKDQDKINGLMKQWREKVSDGGPIVVTMTTLGDYPYKVATASENAEAGGAQELWRILQLHRRASQMTKTSHNVDLMIQDISAHRSGLPPPPPPFVM